MIWEGKPDLKFYKENFEKKFLERSREEYDAKAKKQISELAAPDYLRWGDECLSHEEKYCDEILDESTREAIINDTEKVLITDRNTEIIN